MSPPRHKHPTPAKPQPAETALTVETVQTLQDIARMAACGRLAEARAKMAATLSGPIAPEKRGATASPALKALGRRATQMRAFDEAVRCFRQAAEAAPADAEAHALLGAALFQCGDAVEARSVLERAVALAPESALARGNLGALQYKLGDIDDAIESLSAAVSADPANMNNRLNLAEAFIEKEMFEEAFVLAQSALDAKEIRERTFLVLANLYLALCDLDRVLYYLKQAVEASDAGDASTPYLFFLQASDAYSDEEIFSEHKRLARMWERPEILRKRHRNTPAPDRRLKLAFVSGDFYDHSVAHFVTPLIRHLDRRQFDVYGISNNTKNDAVTRTLRDLANHWFDCHGLNDAALADWVETQGIDILIDLSGHTARHRLGMFARKPAPVQATYLGYPGTTGLQAMDYRITCESLDPSGVAERFHTEKLVRLPGLLAPFEPKGDVAINDLPSLTGAPFTFACLNPIWRINPSIVGLWAQILHARPDARMMLGNVDSHLIAQRLLTLFEQEGVPRERLILYKRQAYQAYLELHHSIDLALDTFPYNGGTTTTYSLWMGVPIVTLQGDRTSARIGGGILGEAGLNMFVARTPEAYVNLALDWANRPHDLQDLRRTLRGRVKIGQSSEQTKLAAEFGDALVGMWRAWCAMQTRDASLAGRA